MLLRHNVVLLEQHELVTTPITGPTHRIRPSDGDVTMDGQQRWWVSVDLFREEGALVSGLISTSFDGLLWHPVLTIPTRRQAHVLDLFALPAFAPLLRVQTLGDGTLPAHRIAVRLASDGPFSAVPG